MSSTPDNTAPMLNAQQLRAALQTLGAQEPHPDDDTAGNEAVYLLGVLLALVETAFYRDIDRADLMAANDGYTAMLSGLSGHDPQVIRRGWALLLQDRLNRTALALGEATDEGEMLTGVIGPSMLVAANMLNVVNQRDMAPDMVTNVFNTADRNLQIAHRTLGEVRAVFRANGFPDL